MLPGFKLLLIDSLPQARMAMMATIGDGTAGVSLELQPDLHQALASLTGSAPVDQPALAVVPLAEWQGQDPASICSALLECSADLPVILTAPEVPEAWRQWVAAHPAAPRLLAMNLPLELQVLRFIGGMTRQARLKAASDATHLAGLTENRPQAENPHISLSHSNERFLAAFRAAPGPQALLNFQTGQMVEVNAAFCEMTGFSSQELLEHSLPALQSTGLLEILRHPHPMAMQRVVCRNRSGTPRHLVLSTQPTFLNGQPHLMILAADRTGEALLEDQLRQAQRMEAMGQLAAGVAHDFNNILTIIQGHLSLQLATGSFSAAARTALTETLAASHHAATLTRQLLALSRFQLFEPAPVDLNALIHRMSVMLQRLIGEHIGVEWSCENGLPQIQGDAPAIEQVVLNLVLQARDAMPNGGNLRIATGLIEVSASRAAQNPEAREGTFVRFSIVDNGCGMDQSKVDQLLKAFASNNHATQDTGSGLAAVHGIIRQHLGWIELFSAPDQGTAFFVYLPVTPQPVPPASGIPQKQGRTGLTVLLVEDEPAVRAILQQLLIHCGCSVLEAPDAPAALQIWNNHKNAIQLLITDIVMPGGMTGHELAARLTDEKPELKVIYSSGYSASLYKEGDALIAGRNFLPKPWDATSVINLIQRVAAEPPDRLGPPNS